MKEVVKTVTFLYKKEVIVEIEKKLCYNLQK
jgi:hypothetical protein